MAKSHDVDNDVYNHLHEKEEDSDIDETYDHAHGNINRTTEESDCSTLNTGRRYMAPDVSATEDSVYYEREQHGDYSSLKKQDNQTDVGFNNTSYETERGADQNLFAEQRTNEKQIVNGPPFAHSVDLPGTKTARTHHGNESSMMKSYDVNDDVYNHLHEKEEDSENDETYDHAHGNISSAMEDSDYNNLNTGIRYKEPDVSVAEVNDYDDREPPGDYCALKKQ
ncbi:uncharacterized protein LOC134262991 [Saccostrea cucullata]|uniref:uncharacterized protein LOC134262991 n=1 Tax=Saccostrea cuccullata TaxID=36930 RepID=UPI002ED18D34